MDYCSKHGIPHSRFLSWSEDDQDKALAHHLDAQAHCSQCGTVPSSWLDEDGHWVEPPPFVPVAQVCGGCEALHSARREVPDDRQPYTHVYLMPFEQGSSDAGNSG